MNLFSDLFNGIGEISSLHYKNEQDKITLDNQERLAKIAAGFEHPNSDICYVCENDKHAMTCMDCKKNNLSYEVYCRLVLESKSRYDIPVIANIEEAKTLIFEAFDIKDKDKKRENKIKVMTILLAVVSELAQF